MPEKTLNEVFSEIADAIRDKSESSETIKPINMAAAIEEIPTGPQLDNDSLYTIDGSGSPTKVDGNACVVTTESGSPVIRSDVHSGYYSTFYNEEEDYALDFEELERNTYINGSGGTRTLDIYSTYYVSGDSGGDAKFLASGYYHIIDGDSNEPSMLEGLDGADVYRFDGDATFEVLSSFPQEDGYYYYASNDSKMFTPAVGAEEGSYYYIWNEELQQQDLTEGYYHYSNDSAALTPYTPGPTPEKGKYYYGNALTAQNLVAAEYYSYIGSDSELYANHFENNCLYYMAADFVKLNAYDNVDHYYYINGVDASKLTGLNGSGYYQFDGNTTFTSYTPGPTPTKGYYYYGNQLTAVNLGSYSYYKIMDRDRAPIQLRGLDGYGNYWYDGDSQFESYTPEPEVGTIGSYYYRGGSGETVEQPLSAYYMYFCQNTSDKLIGVNAHAAEWDDYKHLFSINIDRSAAEGESGYDYYDGIYSYTLNSSDWTVDLVKLKLTAGSAYTWNGHSFIPYTPESDLDALMQEVF